MRGNNGVRLREISFDFTVKAFLLLASVSTLYPFVYVVSMSISSQQAVLSQSVWLWPVGFSLKSYELVFSNPQIGIGFYNTLWYTVVGTILSVFVTILAAYPLSRKEFGARNKILFAIVFTMYFSGGMIPLFLLVVNLELYNTRWAIIIPSLVSAFNLIISKSFFDRFSASLIESAKIDGYHDIQIFFRIVVPLSKPIIAVMCLFYAVERWNNYFSALLFLRKDTLQPIQIFLMRVLVQSSENAMFPQGFDNFAERAVLSMQMKYALIVATMLPIILIYPFIQRYFVKGVMLGAIKE